VRFCRVCAAVLEDDKPCAACALRGTMTAATTLAAALVEAQREVKSVAKDAKFGGGPNDRGPKYAYASSEAVYGEARRALTSAGLAASLTSSEVYTLSYVDTYTSEHGVLVSEPVTQVMLRCHFVLVHAASDASRESMCEFPVVQGKGRPLDKALMGARTTALAYYLRDLLLMQRGDFDEVDSREDGVERTRESHDADDRQPHEIAHDEISACKTMRELTEVGRKLGDTPESVIGGAYRTALQAEWAAKRDALKGAP
jgi:hypothetical protein